MLLFLTVTPGLFPNSGRVFRRLWEHNLCWVEYFILRQMDSPSTLSKFWKRCFELVFWILEEVGKITCRRWSLLTIIATSLAFRWHRLRPCMANPIDLFCVGPRLVSHPSWVLSWFVRRLRRSISLGRGCLPCRVDRSHMPIVVVSHYLFVLEITCFSKFPLEVECFDLERRGNFLRDS